MRYIAKILDIDSGNNDELNSPCRESKGLPPSVYQVRMKVEIIGIGAYQEPSKIKRFLCKIIRKYPSGKAITKTSFTTTIGYRSFEEVEKYRNLENLGSESSELRTVITLMRLIDLREGELIEFSYPDEPDWKDQVLNLIRHNNQILSIEELRSKSYPKEIDNTLEDKALRFPYNFIGLSDFKKLDLNPLKKCWFRFQAKHGFLIEAKQDLFYTKRSTWTKIKWIFSSFVGIVTLIYLFIPALLKEEIHRWISAIANIFGIVLMGLKDPFK